MRTKKWELYRPEREAMRPEKWELYLTESDMWARCPLDRAIVWMIGGGLVKCYR